jgi:hypothetical protein
MSRGYLIWSLYGCQRHPAGCGGAGRGAAYPRASWRGRRRSSAAAVRAAMVAVGAPTATPAGGAGRNSRPSCSPAPASSALSKESARALYTDAGEPDQLRPSPLTGPPPPSLGMLVTAAAATGDAPLEGPPLGDGGGPAAPAAPAVGSDGGGVTATALEATGCAPVALTMTASPPPSPLPLLPALPSSAATGSCGGVVGTTREIFAGSGSPGLRAAASATSWRRLAQSFGLTL